MLIKKSKWTGFGVAALALCAQACALDASSGGDVEGESPVGETKQAWTAACPNFDSAKYDGCRDSFDDSGFVQTRIYTCKPFAASETPVAVCPVEAGFVLVGGGASVTSTGSGGFLVSSFPVADKFTWFASSKSHIFADAHTLTAYAVGLKLKNYSAASLKSAVKLNSATSASSGFPSAVAAIPADHVLVGGGAQSVAQGSGHLLYASMPAGTTAWAAYAKQHSVAASGTMTAYAISVPRCPPGLGWCLSTAASGFTVGATGTGPQAALVQIPTNQYAYTSPGAVSMGHNNVTNSGRLLTAILPVGAGNGMTVAWGDDQGYVDSGSVTAYYVAARRQP